MLLTEAYIIMITLYICNRQKCHTTYNVI